MRLQTLLPTLDSLPVEPKTKKTRKKGRLNNLQSNELSLLDTIFPYIFPDEILDDVISEIKSGSERNFILWQYEKEVEMFQDALLTQMNKSLTDIDSSDSLLLEVIEWVFDSAFNGKGEMDNFTYFSVMNDRGLENRDATEFFW